GAQSAPTGKRASPQPGQSRQGRGSRREARVHQLAAGDHSAAAARQLRLRRRPEGAGQVLHDLFQPRLQLPAARVRGVVAHPVPPLGHGQGRAGLSGRRQTGPPARHLSRGDEGGGRHAQGRRGPEVRVVRRRPLRRDGSRKVRNGIPDPQPLMTAKRLAHFLLPLTGIVMVGLAWLAASRSVRDLPSPLRTWEESKLYLLQPFDKRGEMDQGIARLAYYSLVRVSKGFALGIALGTPLGLLLGLSRTLNRMFDPVIQILRPISPLAWLPLGLVVFQKSEPAAMFAIA